MYSDDLAEACLFFLKKKTKETIINIGSSDEMTIEGFAKLIIKKFNSSLKIKFDKSKPDGVRRKIVDSTIAKKYGWRTKFTLSQGIDLAIKSFLKKIN